MQVRLVRVSNLKPSKIEKANQVQKDGPPTEWCKFSEFDERYPEANAKALMWFALNDPNLLPNK